MLGFDGSAWAATLGADVLVVANGRVGAFVDTRALMLIIVASQALAFRFASDSSARLLNGLHQFVAAELAASIIFFLIFGFILLFKNS